MKSGILNSVLCKQGDGHSPLLCEEAVVTLRMDVTSVRQLFSCLAHPVLLSTAQVELVSWMKNRISPLISSQSSNIVLVTANKIMSLISTSAG